MPDIDNSALILPAYLQRFDNIDTECEINAEAHAIYAEDPIGGSWAPGRPYGPSRAFLGYFDDLMDRRAGEKGAERAIRSLIRHGVVSERDWPTNASTYRKRPPDQVIARATFPVRSYERCDMVGQGVFEWMNWWLRMGKVIVSHLRLTDAIQKVGPDGIMPTMYTSHGINHVVIQWGKVEKRGNPDWYAFRNHAGTNWGRNGDFFVNKVYLHAMREQCEYYVLNPETA